jgi:hypothetical protein
MCSLQSRRDAPLLVRLARTHAASAKRLIQHHEPLHTGHVEQAPIGKRALALTAHLEGQKLDAFTRDTVVVRLCDSLDSLISELNQTSVLNRES